MLRPAVERFLKGETRGPASGILRALLVPPALLYSAVAAGRRFLYQAGCLRRVVLPVPVLSVGNLTAGGTGKTPFVRLLCRLLQARGERPAVLSRGYGAPAGGEGLDEEGQALRRDLEGLEILQGRDRAALALKALAGETPPTCFVLDDGAQHLRLARSLDVLLVDAARPFGSGFTPPAGLLREPPLPALQACTLVVITRCDETSEDVVELTLGRLRRRCPGLVVLRSRHEAERLLPAGDPSELAGRRVWLLSGIAGPRSFRHLVERLGAIVLGHDEAPDHHAFTPAEVAEVLRRARDAGGELLLATGKDEPKLRPLLESLPPERTLPFRALEVRHALAPGDEARLAEWLDAALTRDDEEKEHA